MRTRSNLVEGGSSKARVISMARSPRKLKKTTGVAVLDGADRLAAGGDDEGRQILVDGAGMLIAQAADRRARRTGRLAEDVGAPALSTIFQLAS